MVPKKGGFIIIKNENNELIPKPLCRLLEKDAKFEFFYSWRSAFEEIKSILVIAPIMVTPDWNRDFEIMLIPVM